MSRKKPVVWNMQTPGRISPEEEALILAELQKRQAAGGGPWSRAMHVRPLGMVAGRSYRILEGLVKKGQVERRSRRVTEVERQLRRTVARHDVIKIVIVEYRIPSSRSA